MRLDDALFNWLQIQLVAEARLDDQAAVDTRDFFLQILTEDHLISSLRIDQVDNTMIHVYYELEGSSKIQKFQRELAERLLSDINENPKYN
ncbi:hypothetical protein Back11_25940 [Paenibacillus baekrokdamisoli]|uniref:Uncharacterized protein n=1 Tax=Paenibacillus baekrokdamisoli TaxID=1712516 RepID=A0A3G9JE33_9BACL|nr:hypothetical protein [Paenibacillus baekrokdamisoli]MBB3070244.1 hypothetical protein [Paenibacillus baekrokdamisoli]BBH21249.1 hypothetical protein Back11_25940 [Paenibacillus baekrokdamisoli]